MADLNQCCSQEAQATCCEPDQKAGCCGDAHGADCGCFAGTSPPVGVEQVRETVREEYTLAAQAAASGAIGPLNPADEQGQFGSALYASADQEGLPAAIDASLGCGVPTAVADLHEGRT